MQRFNAPSLGRFILCFPIICAFPFRISLKGRKWFLKSMRTCRVRMFFWNLSRFPNWFPLALDLPFLLRKLDTVLFWDIWDFSSTVGRVKNPVQETVTSTGVELACVDNALMFWALIYRSVIRLLIFNSIAFPAIHTMSARLISNALTVWTC
jgi:hypothetical protein